VNILDWASAYGFPLSVTALKAIDIPALVLWGEASHPAVQRANVLLAESMRHTASAEISGAGHFMIATHPEPISRLIAQHVHGAEALAEASCPA